jgi:hypothetical protein
MSNAGRQERVNSERVNPTADRIVAMRLLLHRELDRLYDILCNPNWTGTVGISISGKAGRPGEPRITEEKYGVCEL